MLNATSDLPLDDWIRSPDIVVTPRRRLAIHVRKGEQHMVNTAVDFWFGRLRGLHTLKQHDWGGTVRAGTPGTAHEGLIFKRFTVRHWRYLHKPHHARHTVLHEAGVRELGFNVPNQVCLMEERRAGMLLDAAVISHELTGVTKLSKLIDTPTSDFPLTDWRALISAFGREVARWHRAGLFHGDMHMGNVLCRFENGAYVFFWIDNDEGRRYARLPSSKRVHDLNHLQQTIHRLPSTDSMRLWRAYFEGAALPETMHKPLMRRVMAKARRYWKKRSRMDNAP